MKNIIIFLLLASFVFAQCPDGQKYDKYWQKCQNICNSYQEWDPVSKTCKNSIEYNSDIYDESTKLDASLGYDNSLIKGRLTNFTGKILIERGLEIIKPKINEPLFPGDTVVVDDSSTAIIQLPDKTIAIDKKTKFTIPSSELAANRTSKITLFFGNIWVKLKSIFYKEEFKLTTPTDSGRRA